MKNPAFKDLPVINLPSMPVAPNPLREMAQAIEEQAEANFFARFGRPIKARSELVTDPGEGPRVKFLFAMAQPGLLPMMQERMWFEGFIEGYRCASNVIRFLLEPAAGDATN